MAFAALITTMTPTIAKEKTVTLKIIETSDVHGHFFPSDFITRRPLKGTMARVATYVAKQRKDLHGNVILLDNGDILQGQPTCYYYNFINTGLTNIAADVINYLGYDAQTVGNHDIETGHEVYDKWIKEVKCPVLGANIIDTKTGQCYVKPYTVVTREGVRVAVLGLLTPAIPNWLREEIWSGLRFDEMVKSARYWVDYIQKNEHPDVLVGLFHSGKSGGIVTDEYEEDASMRIAEEVPGFDIVMFGHDHTKHDGVVKNTLGQDVVCLDPSSNALLVAEATVELKIGKRGKVLSKKVSGQLVSMEDLDIDEQYTAHFQSAVDSVTAFVNRKIGEFENAIYSRDSYFGNSAFNDFIQQLQLRITGADISFCAPVSFNATINAGPVYVSDMFNLYRYENQLYVMRLTGEEIRKHLEMSYDLWVNTMKTPDDHIMLLDQSGTDDKQRFMFKNLAFNFDSAMGIDYEVDVTKPDGEKVHILRMSNGEPFDESKWYKVAINSYRGNGGGELLTKGAGITKEELKSRIIYQTERDLRHYLMLEIEEAGKLNPQPANNWRFVPTEWTVPAIARDKALIFGK